VPLGIDALPTEQVREAVRLLTHEDAPASRVAAARALRDALGAYGAVRALVDRAPGGAREAFLRLVQEGPASVEELLGRGWWGHGTLPPPLDWLQRRALVAVGDDGLVWPTDEARAGFADQRLDLAPRAPLDAEPLHLEPARCVVVAPSPAALDRALTVVAAQLRAIAPTVAVSDRAPEAVRGALAGAGVRLDDADVAAADPAVVALPGTVEEAVGPRAVRALLTRALDERRQVRLTYFASSRGGAATERVVDPWSFRDDLLSGYCHLRTDERTFAVDRIGRALLLPTSVVHHST
jgi:hypothetical protein